MQQKRTLRIITAILSIIIGVIYLLNPTAGALELIPDVMPIVGNLDEAAATGLLLWGLNMLRNPDTTPPLPADRSEH
jgi:uncharacterized membrane protein YkvA (DUF1232 family)